MFNDGSEENDTVQNPVHTFTNPGTYTVELNATNDAGNNTEAKTEYIVVTEPAVVFQDNFDDNNLNSSFWIQSQEGGPQIAETNQQLEISIPSESMGENFRGVLSSNYQLHGDFDIQIDYSVIEWPSQNGVRLGISSGNYTIERVSSAPSKLSGQEVYVTDFAGDIHLISTSDTTGKLRLVRQGSTLTAYYFNTDHWASLASGQATAEDNNFWIGAWSHDIVFSDNPVKLALDNFTINNGELIFPLENQPPVASFEASPTSGQAPLKVIFTDTSTGDGITSREWHYKLNSDNSWIPLILDGESSFIFSDIGTYDINLTVTGPVGSDSEIKTDYITVNTQSSAPVYNPVNGHYYDIISGQNGITWSQAKIAAESQTYEENTGHLATITSTEEQDFIVANYGVFFASNNYFLGGYQPAGSAEPLVVGNG